MKRLYILLILASFGLISQAKAGSVTNDNNYCTANGNATAKSIVYKVNGKVVSSLASATAGSTVEIDFTTSAGTSPTMFSLVTYTAPKSAWDANLAYQQTVYDFQSKVFSAGTNHVLTAKVPSCYFQIDFVKGCIIEQFGQGSALVTYSSQGRLVASGNGGSAKCTKVASSCVQGDASATSVTYYVNGKGYSNLNSVKPGSVVTVKFTTADGTHGTRFSLVSYTASASSFTKENALDQQVYDSATALVGPGTHYFTVNVPSCYFQIDFVEGCIIDHFGPVGSANYYNDRKIAWGNGGSEVCQVIDTTACDTCDGGITLPVKLIGFDAKKLSPSTVLLQWSTASEINNDYVAIEKSTDVNNWKEVCRVSGAPGGMSNSKRDYSCVDNRANEDGQNLVYYRPKQVDFNGTYEYFDMIRIRLQDAAYQTSVDNVYPNPATDNLVHISYNSAENGTFNMRVMNMSGQVLLTNHFVAQQGHQTIDLELPETTLKSGFYILEVQNENSVFRQKIYKQ